MLCTIEQPAVMILRGVGQFVSVQATSLNYITAWTDTGYFILCNVLYITYVVQHSPHHPTNHIHLQVQYN